MHWAQSTIATTGQTEIAQPMISSARHRDRSVAGQSLPGNGGTGGLSPLSLLLAKERRRALAQQVRIAFAGLRKLNDPDCDDLAGDVGPIDRS